MKGKKKYIVAFSTIVTLTLLAMLLLMVFGKKVDQKSTSGLSSEDLRALNYEQVSDKEEKAEGEYVKFLAFFTRDLNNDGYAEKIKGTCKNLSDTDELYIELNVLTNGYLEEGEITLEAGNFTWKTSIISDNIVNGSYIGETTKIKLQDKIYSGSQKTMWGTISPKIGNNIHNYTNDATVTLRGYHVADDEEGTRTPIEKTVNLKVDWYGEVEAKIPYLSLSKSKSDIVTNNNTVKFYVDIDTKENIDELLLAENQTTVEIPQLNGYNPSKVTTSAEYSYDETTRTLTITRKSTVDADGNITKSLARRNTYTVTIEYPIDAYVETADTFVMEIPVSTYYAGYNNENEPFVSPLQSNIAKDIVVIKYSEPKGYIYNFDIEIGEYVRNKYVISKKLPLKIYSGKEVESTKDYYTVRWKLDSGTLGDITEVEIKETPEEYTDKFLNTSNEFTSMLKYINNIGIYFTGASSSLGNDGYINIYNDETDELIHTFTKADWGIYTASNPYTYDEGIKHIRVETSKVAQDSLFSVYHIKEIDCELVTEDILKQDFDEIKYIYSYLQGSVQLKDKDKMDSVDKVGIARYEEELSYSTISINKSQISIQETVEGAQISINTIKSLYNDADWQNGQFIVKLPSEFILATINSITTNKENVSVVGYDVYEQDGNYFIKIITENEEEDTYKITINCNLTPNPSTETSKRNLELYSYNEVSQNYYNPKKDIYDVNGNNNLEENVNYSTTAIEFISPSTIITSQYLSNYDNKDSITIAPKIAEITKEDNTAKVNITLLNNYARTISEVKLIGVIPSKGNSYFVNGRELDSEFDVEMNKSGIQIPDNLKDIVTVYYSENLKPTTDLEDKNNGWTKTPSNWSKVRTFLIDFGDYNLVSESSYTFNYEIKVPESVQYNQVSYSEHAVYFALETNEGKLLTQTEPNKLGIKVVRKYTLNLTKYKKGSLRIVPGATYKLVEIDEEGNALNSKLLTTKEDGQCSLDNLYVGKKYVLTEATSPNSYIKNTDEIEFTVNEDKSGNLKIEVTSEDKFSKETTIDSNKNLVSVSVDDMPKYQLILNKTSLADEKLKNVKYEIKENKRTYKTDEKGQLVIDGLIPEENYTLVEKAADGYYVDTKEKTFKLVYEGSNIKVESNDENIKKAIIVNNDEIDMPTVEVSFTNEKIPTYNLNVLKVAENDDENQGLKGATIQLTSEDKDSSQKLKTDDTGMIQFKDLYLYVDGKNITGKYVLKELVGPDGYATNSNEEISFRVKKEDEELIIEVDNEDDLTILKEIKIEKDTITIIIENKPLFKLTKYDEDGKTPLPNAKFMIYKMDSQYSTTIDFAKDVNGNYIGEKYLEDENEQNAKYIVTTDEKGEIIIPLAGGYYKAVEVEAPEGYVLAANEENRTQYFKVEGYQEKGDLEIDSIEDLVEFSESVRNGENYAGKTVTLARTLDFEDDDSYENPNDKTTYKDYNNDNIEDTIKTELTTGSGFKPIGSDTKFFQGIFNGNGYEIRNIHIDSNNDYVGLFRGVSLGKILNLGLSGGSIKGNSKNIPNGTGAIVGYSYNSTISNVYSDVEIVSTSDSIIGQGIGYYIGGICGEAIYTSITNAYNLGDFYVNTSVSMGAGYYIGGILGHSSSVGNNINFCYNKGNMEAISGVSCFGGIVGYNTGSLSINNCFNDSDITRKH